MNSTKKIDSFSGLIQDIVDSTQNAFNEYNKNYKGYMYDSLCYRYQLARYKACEADAMDLVMTKGISKREAEAKARQAYERDCLRFYQKLIMIIQKLFYRILKYQIIHILNMNGIIVFNLEEGAI